MAASVLFISIFLLIPLFVRKFCQVLPGIRILFYLHLDVVKQLFLFYMNVSHFHQLQDRQKCNDHLDFGGLWPRAR